MTKIKRSTMLKFLSHERVFEAFKNKDGKPEPRTWPQLRAQIPAGTLSRALKDLIKTGNVRAYLRVGKSGKRETVYELVHEWHTVTMGVVKATVKGSNGEKEEIGEYWPKFFYRRGSQRGRGKNRALVEKLHCQLIESEKKRLEEALKKRA